MDDAAGGERGLKPTLTPAIVDAVARTWGLGLDAATTLRGSTGLNLLVDDDGGRVVVRVHRRHVSHARVEALQLAREAARAGSVPTAAPLRGRDEQRCVVADGCAIEVEEFVDADATMETLIRLRKAMPLFARLHDVLAGADLPEAANDLRFGNYLSPADVSERVARGVRRIRSLGSSLIDMADNATALAAGVMAAANAAVARTAQWCHGDFWDNNVLFRDGEVALVADFGFMNRRSRVDDLALTLYFALCDLDADGRRDAAAEIARLVAAYNSGTSRPLSDDELDEIPVAIARQPLWSIGVWAAELDDDGEVVAHLAGHDVALSRGLEILDHVGGWRRELRFVLPRQ